MTRAEKETVLVFDEEDKIAHIQTYNARLQKRLAKIHEERPEECKEVKTYFDTDDGATAYTFPAKWVKINPSVKLSEEEKERRAEVFKNAVSARKNES